MATLVSEELSAGEVLLRDKGIAAPAKRAASHGRCELVEPRGYEALQHLLFDATIPEWPVSQGQHHADNPLCRLWIVVSDPGEVSRDLAQQW